MTKLTAKQAEPCERASLRIQSSPKTGPVDTEESN